ILASYNPRPPMIRVENTGQGTTVRYFRVENLYHTLELEEHGGKLFRATLEFDSKSVLDRRGNAEFQAREVAANLISSCGQIPADRLAAIPANLNLARPWMPGTSRVTINGVKITRTSNGDSLSLDVIPANP